MLPARDPRTRRLLACGVVAPPLFAAVVASLGALRPGYDHVTMVMSRLGEQGAPNALAMGVLGFGLLGALTLAFAAGLARLAEGRLEKAGAALLALSAVAVLGVGVFACDPGCGPGSPRAALHSASAAVTGAAMLLALLAFVMDARQKADRPGAAVALACFLVMGAAGLLFTAKLVPWVGAMQRVSLGAPAVWMAFAALRALRAVRAQPA